ncbi:MAG: hypothetical protein OJF52_001325 [Nitrospira sp.]|nr:MAG: hypothetical protein OJF52_001325 [Nitrospira sp.]
MEQESDGTDMAGVASSPNEFFPTREPNRLPLVPVRPPEGPSTTSGFACHPNKDIVYGRL